MNGTHTELTPLRKPKKLPLILFKKNLIYTYRIDPQTHAEFDLENSNLPHAELTTQPYLFDYLR
jgi:hypothetical protein